ncbi:MAG: thioredoxin-disulfide reductase [Oscillospiraceae bacterium]|nr:thioredoxin-disulfide reductase [Oscillospiraceae bacterium]
MDHIYDMLIIGGGPGGYTAALYAARAGLDALLIERLSAGGQLALTHRIDNYPGADIGIDGWSLAEKMRQGAEHFGAKSLIAEVTSLSLEGEIKTAETTEGVFHGRTVLISTGADPRMLGLDGEWELTGRGVHYCAACDGMFYRGKTVAVVGGGNTAAADALLLSRLAKKVILIHRRDSLKATKIYHAPLMEAENVEIRWNSAVGELVQKDGRLAELRLRDLLTGEEENLPVDGVFVSIGRRPATALLGGQLELDEGGYIAADESTRTNIPGVFAVGDVRSKALRQVVTAVGDGAVAVHFAEEYLASSLKGE